MSQRWLLLLLVFVVLAPAQQVPSRIVRVDDTEPETARLYRFYGQENRDPAWSTRLALLLSAIQKDPTASFLSSPETYFGMPIALRDQVKQSWIVQVQQHPDDARVLRNAVLALDNRSPPPPPPLFPSSVPAPNQIRVGGNVQAANILSKVQPEYPALARQAGIQGTVRFSATISPEGRITTLTLVSGHPLLVNSATQAVQQWSYKPTLLNGNPVAVITTIDVNFTLEP